MTAIILKQMPAFKRAFRRLHKNQKNAVENAIYKIIDDPEIGNEKKGDLVGIYVYKFKVIQQEFLLAYEWDPQSRLLLALGVHENFYRDLKKQIN